MEDMYHSKMDRLYILQKLILNEWEKAKEKGITQEKIEEYTEKIGKKISQSTIGKIFPNLDQYVSEDTKRENIIGILANDLMKVDPKTIDAILWLSGKDLLTGEEINNYVKRYSPQAQHQTYNSGELRSHVLKLLEKIKEKLDPVVTIYKRDEEGMVNSDKALLKMEKKGEYVGERRVVSEAPSFLTYPGDVLEKVIQGMQFSKETEKKIIEINNKRLDLFENNIEKYGERSIHSKNRLGDYLNCDPPKKGYRIQQINRCIELLGHPYYDMRLSDATHSLEWEGKTSAIFVRGIFREEDYVQKEQWGAASFLMSDKAFVLSFLLDFETEWDRLSKNQSKQDVIDFFRGLLVSCP